MSHGRSGRRAAAIHQKIGLQSAKRRLQSGGKSTYSDSRRDHTREPALSRLETAIEEGGSSISSGAGIAAWNRHRSCRTSAKERWQPPANTPKSESFPGTTTRSMSSAWSVAKSSIPKNFAIWKLKKRLEPKICTGRILRRQAEPALDAGNRFPTLLLATQILYLAPRRWRPGSRCGAKPSMHNAGPTRW